MRALLALGLASASVLLTPTPASADVVVIGGGFRAGFRARAGFGWRRSRP